MSNIISLLVKCPHCDKLLMDDNHLLHDKPSVKINVVSEKERGVIWLCSVYGCYDHESNIEINKGDVINFFCPHCNKSLMRDIKCQICEAPMIGLNIKTGGKVNVCSRSGCENHYVVFDDLAGAINKFYHELGTSG